MECCTYALPKHGHSSAEYEDAAAADPARGRYAIADGASESSFAGEWARLLVETFVSNPQAGLAGWHDWLPPLQQRWAQRPGTAAALSWYSEIKAQLGAQATFAGLAVGVEGLAGGPWQALAIGDSCVFQVREGALVASLPIQHSSEFSTQPALVSSVRGQQPAAAQGTQQFSGRWTSGDRFWLLTDALAHWFLRQNERGNDPWSHVEATILRPHDPSAFCSWIEKLRELRGIRNDDTTLIHVKL
jgi:hypothetical protein